MPDRLSITVRTVVATPPAEAWARWNDPNHITRWYFASPDWTCPRASNDPRPGGRFSFRMEAGDGSAGFDFSGRYLSVEPLSSLRAELDDGRALSIAFRAVEGGTEIEERFEAEETNPPELQRAGWQAILDSFASYSAGTTAPLAAATAPAAPPIVPCLWFDGKAQEAAEFYARAFPDARIVADAGLTVSLQVADLRFTLLNGGPEFAINPSISFFYNVEDEAAIDGLWARLSEGGSALMPLGAYPFARKYGWVADRYGVNWQLIWPHAQPRRKAFPSLMFTRGVAGRAEEAIRFYASIFAPSETGTLSRYGPGQEPDREGALNYGEFRLGGQWFSAMDSAHAHEFSFSEGLSLAVECSDQEEVDYFWSRLSEGGSESQCGWLKDKFGVSWQVVPRVLGELMADPVRAPRVVAAFMKMTKLDIAELERA